MSETDTPSLKPLYDWIEDIYSENKGNAYKAMAAMPAILEKTPKELLVKDKFIEILAGQITRRC